MKTIFYTRFGSHLYGTNTPNSDEDFKGIFIETLDNIILGRDSETMLQNSKDKNNTGRNTKEDTDIELKELRRFIKDAMDGQTYAIDMLFANDANIIGASDEWKYITSNRDKLLSKDLKPFLGYIYKQTAKYGLKGSRLHSLKLVIDILSTLNRKQKLKEVIHLFPKNNEYIQFIEIEHRYDGKSEMLPYLKVLEKKFAYNMFIGEILDTLNNTFEKYGDRAKLAMENNGVDWKAVSHAYRACYQVMELAETGEIIFPLKQRDKILLVKNGEVPYSVVSDELVELMEIAKEKVENSTVLNDKPDRKFWDKFILDVYLKN